MFFPHWLRKQAFRGHANKSAPRFRLCSRSRPQLEVLEARVVPSTLTVTSTADSGTGSLRAEIAAAQNGDTIVFDPSLSGQTVSLSSGPLAISASITIQGAGAVAVSGNNQVQLFDILNNASVTLSGLTIENGVAAQGGAVYQAGGVLTLSGCTFLNDEALSTAGAAGTDGSSAQGGAIYEAGGTLNVSSSTFTGNTAVGGAGGAWLSGGTAAGAGGAAAGGAIYAAAGTGLSVMGSTFTNNQALGGAGGASMVGVMSDFGSASGAGGAALGGALYYAGGSDLSLTDSSFLNNLALGGAGGDSSSGFSQDISVDGVNGGSGGQAAGGALYFDAGQGSLSLSGSTFSGDRATGGVGGAGSSISSVGAVYVTDPVTVAFVFAGFGGAGGAASGGAVSYAGGGSLTVSGSSFSADEADGGAGGTGGAASATAVVVYYVIGGQGGQGGQASGGAIEDVGKTSLTASSSSFTGDTVRGGDGGGSGAAQGTGTATMDLSLRLNNGGPAFVQAVVGLGGFGGTAQGGAIDHQGGTSTSISACTFTSDQAVGGAGGAGAAATALGGAFSSGGAGGGSGGVGGTAQGGALANAGGTSLSMTNCTLTSNEALGGTGGAGADATSTGGGRGAENSNSGSGTGGSGGFALGGAISESTGSTFTLSVSTLSGNEAVGGAAAQSGSDSATGIASAFAESVLGQFGETGGWAQGGGMYVGSSVNLVVSSRTIDGNQALGGQGGDGGDSTATAHNSQAEVVSVSEDNPFANRGGDAQGGGIYYDGGANVSLSGTDLSNDWAVGGDGGALGVATASGALAFAEAIGPAGAGGNGLGGALYLASGKNVSLDSDTFAADQALGGSGGTGGSATATLSGMSGFALPGSGGGGGAGEGGALYDAGASSLVISNSLFSTDLAVGGAGGDGGDALVLSTRPFFQGGNGGNGGLGAGGAIFQAAGKLTLNSSTFLDDQATSGTGGSAGTGSGTAGLTDPSLGGAVDLDGGSAKLNNLVFQGDLADLGVNVYPTA